MAEPLPSTPTTATTIRPSTPPPPLPCHRLPHHQFLHNIPKRNANVVLLPLLCLHDCCGTGNTSIPFASLLCCRGGACKSSRHWGHRQSTDVFVCGTTAPTKRTPVKEVAVTPISAAEKRGITMSPSACSNKHTSKNSKKNSAKNGTATRIACAFFVSAHITTRRQRRMRQWRRPNSLVYGRSQTATTQQQGWEKGGW